jgi:hypothetical protein
MPASVCGETPVSLSEIVYPEIRRCRVDDERTVTTLAEPAGRCWGKLSAWEEHKRTPGAVVSSRSGWCDERDPSHEVCALGNDRIAYQVVDDGPVDLLWVSGIGNALDARWEYGPYASFLGRLASFSRLIMMDRRGMGASDPVPLDALPNWEEFVDDALAVLDAASSERTVLLGSNDAGLTAILFADPT